MDLSKNGWIPIWVFSIYRDLSIFIPDDYVAMHEWCQQHCFGKWTTGWWQEDLAFWFETPEDAMVFQLTWW